LPEDVRRKAVARRRKDRTVENTAPSPGGEEQGQGNDLDVVIAEFMLHLGLGGE